MCRTCVIGSRIFRLLVDDLMESLVTKGLKKKAFSRDALEELMSHSWPGNVRELRNFVERLAIMCPEQEITARQIRAFLPQDTTLPAEPEKGTLAPYRADDFKEARKRFEKEFLQFKLTEQDGNISRTAEKVGLERSHLHKKLKSLGIIS